jgi:hypothetical protein
MVKDRKKSGKEKQIFAMKLADSNFLEHLGKPTIKKSKKTRKKRDVKYELEVTEMDMQ